LHLVLPATKNENVVNSHVPLDLAFSLLVFPIDCLLISQFSSVCGAGVTKWRCWEYNGALWWSKATTRWHSSAKSGTTVFERASAAHCGWERCLHWCCFCWRLLGGFMLLTFPSFPWNPIVHKCLYHCLQRNQIVQDRQFKTNCRNNHAWVLMFCNVMLWGTFCKCLKSDTELINRFSLWHWRFFWRLISEPVCWFADWLQMDARLKDIMRPPPPMVTSSTPISKAITLLLDPQTKILVVLNSRTTYFPNKEDEVSEKVLGFVTKGMAFDLGHSHPFGSPS